MKRLPAAATCLALALLSFFRFPGHTWLQQDTQIYVPIIEHQSDPAVLRNDLLVQKSHVAFTLYDEAARVLRAVSGLGLREVLGAQLVVTRALGIWGFYLMATALGFEIGPAFLIAAICALGVMVRGPQVLSFEYEPTPRAFALPLVFCAIGLAAHRRHFAAGAAAAVALLYHPPTVIPFLVVFAVVTVRERFLPLIPCALAGMVLALHAYGEGGQSFFGTITPLQEQIQRLRTAYVWISTWHAAWIVHYCLLAVIAAVAFARLRRRIKPELAPFLLVLPALGLLSMPASWALLERAKWVLIPQVQPLRTLLYVVVAAQFLTAAAAVHAAMRRRIPEAVVWFFAAYLVPLQQVFTEGLEWTALLMAAGLAIVALQAVRHPVLAVLAFAIAPRGYPDLHTPQLAQLSAWARGATPRDAVFLFPDAGHNLDPGIFRAEALRAIFVDWKGGGQVNYRGDFAEEWWARWQLVSNSPIDPARYEAFGVSYIVVRPGHRLPRAAAFENAGYVVYRVRELQK